jgi:hypothetical protein
MDDFSTGYAEGEFVHKYVVSKIDIVNQEYNTFNQKAGDLFGERSIMWRWDTLKVGTDHNKRILATSEPIDELKLQIVEIGYYVDDYEQEPVFDNVESAAEVVHA